jgi:hypothetical protein
MSSAMNLENTFRAIIQRLKKMTGKRLVSRALDELWYDQLPFDKIDELRELGYRSIDSGSFRYAVTIDFEGQYYVFKVNRRDKSACSHCALEGFNYNHHGANEWELERHNELFENMGDISRDFVIPIFHNFQMGKELVLVVPHVEHTMMTCYGDDDYDDKHKYIQSVQKFLTYYVDGDAHSENIGIFGYAPMLIDIGYKPKIDNHEEMMRSYNELKKEPEYQASKEHINKLYERLHKVEGATV